jgi:hypothetical protein
MNQPKPPSTLKRRKAAAQRVIRKAMLKAQKAAGGPAVVIRLPSDPPPGIPYFHRSPKLKNPRDWVSRLSPSALFAYEARTPLAEREAYEAEMALLYPPVKSRRRKAASQNLSKPTPSTTP